MSWAGTAASFAAVGSVCILLGALWGIEWAEKRMLKLMAMGDHPTSGSVPVAPPQWMVRVGWVAAASTLFAIADFAW